MNRRSRTAQIVAMTLSTLITLCTVLALNALAGSDHAAAQAQQLAVAAAARA